MDSVLNETGASGRAAFACLALCLAACGQSESDPLGTATEQPGKGNPRSETDASLTDATGGGPNDPKDAGASSSDPEYAVAACSLQRDCEDGLFCHRKQNTCVQCLEASDCESGTPCEHGRCGMAQRCNNPQDCAANAVCIEGQCAPVVCPANALVCAGRAAARCNDNGSGFTVDRTYCGEYPCELIDGVAQCSAPPIPKPPDALNTNGDLSLGGDGWIMSTPEGQVSYEPDAGEICTSLASLTVIWSDSPGTLPGGRYLLSYRTFTTRIGERGDSGSVRATVAGTELPLVTFTQNGFRDISVEFETEGDRPFELSLDLDVSAATQLCIDDVWVVPVK